MRKGETKATGFDACEPVPAAWPAAGPGFNELKSCGAQGVVSLAPSPEKTRSIGAEETLGGAEAA